MAREEGALRQIEGDERGPVGDHRLDLGDAGGLWKCPRISDLPPLESLAGLTHVAIYWNQRVDRLWDLSRTPLLRELRFEDFTRLPNTLQARSLEPIWTFEQAIICGKTPKDVIVVGKRKPWLSSKHHADRIHRYVEEFRPSPGLEADQAVMERFTAK